MNGAKRARSSKQLGSWVASAEGLRSISCVRKFEGNLRGVFEVVEVRQELEKG